MNTIQNHVRKLGGQLAMILLLLTTAPAWAQNSEATPEVRILTYTNTAYSDAPGYQGWIYPDGGTRTGGGYTRSYSATEFSRYSGGQVTNFWAWRSYEGGYGGGGWDYYYESKTATFWSGQCPTAAVNWSYWTNFYSWEGVAMPYNDWDQSSSTDTNFTWEPYEARQALSISFQPTWTLEFDWGLPHTGCYYKRTNYSQVDTTLEVFAGGFPDSTNEVMIQLNVWASDNVRGRWLTWNEVTVTYRSATGTLVSQQPDTNNNVFIPMQDNQWLPVSFSFSPTNDLPTNALPGSFDFTFWAWAGRQSFLMGVDRNGDGSIELYGTNDATSSSLPFLFWPNDDRDYYAYHDSIFTLPAYYEFDDIQPGPGTDYYLDYIHSERDVEDFAPLIIQIPFSQWDTNWFLRITGGKVKLFVGGDGGLTYLIDPTASSALVGTNGTTYLGDTGVGPVYISLLWFTNSSQLNLLFEAGDTGKFALKAELMNGSHVIASSRVWLDIKNVKSFYDQWVVGDLDGQWPTVEYVPAATATPTYLDPAVGAQLTQGTNYILFVHGWNMQKWQKEAFADTAFKRLWWQGYRGRFGAFRWPTYELSVSTWISFLRNYDCSEFNAWRSAPALKQVILDLNAPGVCERNVRLMAHSMGNVVAGEALRQLGGLTVTGSLNGGPPNTPNDPPIPGTDWKYIRQYLAFQGAIPAHCYDSQGHGIPFNPIAADDLTPNRYAEYWTVGNGPYVVTPKGAESYRNYTNPKDFALKKWVLDQHLKPDESLGYFYSASAAQSSFWNSGIRRLGFLSLRELLWPQDTHEIFAFGIEPRSKALGAALDVQGLFEGQQFDLMTERQFDETHDYHSKQFRSTIALQKGFWERVLSDFGF